jgi:hypothetical protein
MRESVIYGDSLSSYEVMTQTHICLITSYKYVNSLIIHTFA